MSLKTELDDGVLTLRLDRPHRLNALDAPTADALVAELRGAAETPDVRVVVLAGAGRAFCAGADTGADLPDPALLPAASVMTDHDGTPTTGGAVPMLDRANALAVALADVPVPVMAAVHGAAIGLGASLALGADLLVMAASAQLRLGFSRIGLVPDGGATHALLRRAGAGTALGMALLDDGLDGPTAVTLGIANRCTPDDSLDTEVARLARALADGPVATHRTAKALLAPTRRGDLVAALRCESAGQLALIQASTVQPSS